MSDIFSGVHGARFPEVVMNQGPLPGAGGLPAPLHDTPDSRINYNNALLGDISPYAYGEPGYLSSQNAYLNIPHRIQKFVPALWLPEPDGKDTFQISHAVDDGDIAFVMRLARNSIFCTGTRVATTRRYGIGNVVDPLINLCTLNYILAGVQCNLGGRDRTRNDTNLWWELLHSLDPHRFSSNRNYDTTLAPVPIGPTRHSRLDYPVHDPLTLDDLIYLVRMCLRPLGIVRGSEKQGGQSETTLSPVSWPVPAMVTLVLDGKDGNVINVWHNHTFEAGQDLVLRLKPMPLKQYTLNHYYKGLVRKTFSNAHPGEHVWQLVPDVHSLAMEEGQTPETDYLQHLRQTAPRLVGNRHGLFGLFRTPFIETSGTEILLDVASGPGLRKMLGWSWLRDEEDRFWQDNTVPWQELGFWHIGRTQVMMKRYGLEEYYCNDLANNLSTNHLEITFQPTYYRHPHIVSIPYQYFPGPDQHPEHMTPSFGTGAPAKRPAWEPRLHLESLSDMPPPRPVQRIRWQDQTPVGWTMASVLPARTETLLPSLGESSAEPAPVLASAPVPASAPDVTLASAPVPASAPEVAEKKVKGRKPRPVEGSLLRTDGVAEASEVTILT